MERKRHASFGEPSKSIGGTCLTDTLLGITESASETHNVNYFTPSLAHPQQYNHHLVISIVRLVDYHFALAIMFGWTMARRRPMQSPLQVRWREARLLEPR